MAPLIGQELLIEIPGELVSKPYIDLTLDVMKRFGVSVEPNEYRSFRIPGGQRYRSPGDVLVEGDASSGTYFLSASAIRGGTVRVLGVGSDSVQGDVLHAEVLEKMGALVRRGPDWVEVSRGELRGIDVDLGHIPDAAMTVAATALFAKGKTVIRNVHNWRFKETDRLAAMATELRKVGAEVVEGEDFLEIDPPAQIRSAAIDTYDDHRMAMCFSLLRTRRCGDHHQQPRLHLQDVPGVFRPLRPNLPSLEARRPTPNLAGRRRCYISSPISQSSFRR